MIPIRLTTYGVVLLAATAVVLSYNSIQRWWHFKKVTGKVIGITYQCQKEGSTLGEFQKELPQAMRACAVDELAPDKNAIFRSAIAQTIVMRYVSPVDQREYQGKVRIIGLADRLIAVPADRRLPILASLSDPAAIEADGAP